MATTITVADATLERFKAAKAQEEPYGVADADDFVNVLLDAWLNEGDFAIDDNSMRITVDVRDEEHVNLIRRASDERDETVEDWIVRGIQASEHMAGGMLTYDDAKNAAAAAIREELPDEVLQR